MMFLRDGRAQSSHYSVVGLHEVTINDAFNEGFFGLALHLIILIYYNTISYSYFIFHVFLIAIKELINGENESTVSPFHEI